MTAVDHPVAATQHPVWRTDDAQHRTLTMGGAQCAAGAMTIGAAVHYLVHDRGRAEPVGASVGLLAGRYWHAGIGLAVDLNDADLAITASCTNSTGVESVTRCPWHIGGAAGETGLNEVLSHAKSGDVLTLVTPAPQATIRVDAGTRIKVSAGSISWCNVLAT